MYHLVEHGFGMAQHLISEAEGYELLKTAGAPVPAYALAHSADEAATAAAGIGFPVVLKIVSPQIVHKSDAGGVIAGLRSEEEVRRAYATILANVRTYNPDAEVHGIIVVKQLKKGLEIIIGGRVDPSFGKIITVGDRKSVV
jgi:acyl-CoA synthetase (NDP forming)